MVSPVTKLALIAVPVVFISINTEALMLSARWISEPPKIAADPLPDWRKGWDLNPR